MSIVQIGLADRTRAVNAFQIEPWFTKILKGGNIFGFLQRRAIVGNIVGDELSKEWPACRNSGIVLT